MATPLTRVSSNAGYDDAEAVRSAGYVPSLLDRLDALEPEFEREIAGNEQAGMLSERTLDLLRATDIPRLLLPEELGGLGMFLRDALLVTERLGRIDASVGWIGGNWSAAGALLSYLGSDAARKLLEGSVPLFGASGAPTGTARPVEGGWRLTGAWAYGSGDLQADYVFCAGIQLDTNGKPAAGPTGLPVVRMFLVPASDILDHGNWDVLGLRATGSIDFAVQDAFIPQEHVVDLVTGRPGGGRQLSGGFPAIVPFLHAGFALGAGRRLLDELNLVAQTPSSRGTVLAGDVLFRAEMARHEIAFRSARAFVMETWQDLDTALRDGRSPLPRRTFTLLRASLVHAHQVVREIAVFAFQRGSGASLRAGVLQRWVRDALAGCQHLIVSDAIYPDLGWELMGAPENMIWGPAGLIALPGPRP